MAEQLEVPVVTAGTVGMEWVTETVATEAMVAREEPVRPRATEGAAVTEQETAPVGLAARAARAAKAQR